MAATVCYRCGQVGHTTRTCSLPAPPGGMKGPCFKCGQMGHISNECPVNPQQLVAAQLMAMGGYAGQAGQQLDANTLATLAGMGLLNVNLLGGAGLGMGAASAMPQQMVGGGSGHSDRCYKCNLPGHQSKNCPQGPAGPNDCFRCGMPGHKASSCTNPDSRPVSFPNAGAGPCYQCGQPGHMSKNCPKNGGTPGVRTCYRCQQPGHVANDCPLNAGTGLVNTVVCNTCNQPGHVQRMCPVKHLIQASTEINTGTYKGGNVRGRSRSPDPTGQRARSRSR